MKCAFCSSLKPPFISMMDKVAGTAMWTEKLACLVCVAEKLKEAR